MSREPLSQIEVLEQACHAAIRAGDDTETITVLVQTLTTVKFTVSENERPIVRGLANLAATHSDMLLDALNSGQETAVVHNGLTRVCHSLVDLRSATRRASTEARGAVLRGLRSSTETPAFIG